MSLTIKRRRERGMKIPIRTTKEKFYRQVLEVLKIFPPVSHLRPKEMGILADIMSQNEQLVTFSKAKRKMIIFSKENRKEMQERHNISSAFLNNILTKLRRYKLLSKTNDLTPILDIIPDNKFSIEIEIVSYETENNERYNKYGKDKI